jgi:hypothetical protein
MKGAGKHFPPLFVNIRHFRCNTCISHSKRVHTLKLKSGCAADKQYSGTSIIMKNIKFNYGRDFDFHFVCSVILWYFKTLTVAMNVSVISE